MRTDEKTLNVLDKSGYKSQARECAVAVQAIEVLENIARAIRRAGGADIELPELGRSTLLDFAVIAARNNIEVHCNYTGPANPA